MQCSNVDGASCGTARANDPAACGAAQLHLPFKAMLCGAPLAHQVLVSDGRGGAGQGRADASAPSPALALTRPMRRTHFLSEARLGAAMQCTVQLIRSCSHRVVVIS